MLDRYQLTPTLNIETSAIVPKTGITARIFGLRLSAFIQQNYLFGQPLRRNT